MTRDEIIFGVRARIDEICAPDDLTLVDDVFSVIDENLEGSANSFLMKAPLWLVPGSTLSISGHRTMQDGGGRLPLPNDFLRLHSFQMNEWDSPVTSVIGEDHPNYRLRKNPHLVAAHRPIVALVAGPQGERSLEYYSVNGDYKNLKGLYVKRVEKNPMNRDNSVEGLPESLMDGLLWQAAADFFIIIQQPQNAQAAELKLVEFLTLNSTSQVVRPETKDKK